MLHMKLGVPIYDNFTEANIEADAVQKAGAPIYFLVNSNNQCTTGVVAQFQAGRLVVLWDAIADGDPGTVLTDLIQSALLALRAEPVPSPRTAEPESIPLGLRLLGSPRHFDEYTVFGLRAACRKAGYELERGGEAAAGREEIRALFRRVSHGGPAIAVSPEASWSLRALAGGYARDADKSLPIENAYAVLMEPLESFAARMRLGGNELATQPNYQYTRDGRRYISALVGAPNG